MNRRLVVVAIVALAACGRSASPPKPVVSLSPRLSLPPSSRRRSAEVLPGPGFTVTASTVIHFDAGDDSAAAVGRYLADVIGIAAAATAIPVQPAPAEPPAGKIRLRTRGGALPDEGYELTVNADGVAREPFTGTEVGFSALCIDKDVTYKFIDDVVREIAALTPGPYFHVGGDEVKMLTAGQYAGFIERVQGIVSAHGKTMIGWDETAATKLMPSSIVQHWRPKTSPQDAVARGTKVILSPADKVYLDMKYDSATAIGLTWAARIDVRDSYNWDPATVLAGVPESAVLGVEAPLWAETIANIRDVEFLAFPRIVAVAEIGWSAADRRRWKSFRERLGAQGPRWTALGVNFYRSPQVPWKN